MNGKSDNYKSVKLTLQIKLIMLFQNILVPWDDSKYSNHAFKVALDMTKKYDSKLSVIHSTEAGEYRGLHGIMIQGIQKQ